jgi:hypothetical protein
MVAETIDYLLGAFPAIATKATEARPANYRSDTIWSYLAQDGSAGSEGRRQRRHQHRSAARANSTSAGFDGRPGRPVPMHGLLRLLGLNGQELVQTIARTSRPSVSRPGVNQCPRIGRAPGPVQTFAQAPRASARSACRCRGPRRRDGAGDDRGDHARRRLALGGGAASAAARRAWDDAAWRHGVDAVPPPAAVTVLVMAPTGAWPASWD